MKVSIIGGGISGLTLGCYLQMNGFDTAIYEKHLHPGGLCTSWKRGGFTFDGCLHWVLGSDSGSAFYKLWSELLDMKSVDFVNHDVRVTIELNKNVNQYGENVFRLYTNIARLESYLLDLAPEDEKMIKDLTKFIRICQRYEMPPMIDKISQMQTIREKVFMIKYFPFLKMFFRWKNVTNYSFARTLKNPFLKEAFELLFDGDEINMMMIVMPLAFCDKKSAGYPVGGSLSFAEKIARKYESLGGQIYLRKEIKNIIVEENTAKGITLTDGQQILSDITISTADWHFTVFQALGGKYTNKSILALQAKKTLEIYPSVMLISLGVSGEFKDYPHFFKFAMRKEYISPDGTHYSRIEAHIYHYDHTLAPSGKTNIAISLYTRNGQFWIDLRNNNLEEYNRCKNEFADAIIQALDEKIGGVISAIEVKDVATPATFHRYTGNIQGSVQGWFPSKNLLASSPVRISLPGLAGFYYSGHWSIPGGGIPTAIKSSRDLAQILCLKYKKPFVLK